MAAPQAQIDAIARQKAAHAAVVNGTEPVPAAEDGPLAQYNRAQSLDYLAQLLVCLRDGASLPNATGPGLTILPGTPREPLDEKSLDPNDPESIPSAIARVSAAGKYTTEEIADAIERLDENLASGVTLDPATAENVV
jgi:hypothetical protein